MSKLDRFKRRAVRHRLAGTDAEQTLWDNLYRIPLEGTHFRRQVKIGPYRADFGSLRLKLLIEVDGKVHDGPSQTAYDRDRTKWLENEGYRVLRFSNLDVTTDMNTVLRAIDLAIEGRKRALDIDENTPPRR